MTRSRADFEYVQVLIRRGLSDTEIFRETGVPRRTVCDWRRGSGGSTKRYDRQSGEHCAEDHDLDDLPADEYAYLLGMYLGDGCIAQCPRGVTKLRIFSDSSYPAIIRACCSAMVAMGLGRNANVWQRKSRCVEISMYSKHWPCLFPQHGPGRKHERRIELVAWQEELVADSLEPFVKGLIHSDGCRVVANDRGVMSVRYPFSNRSEDIKVLYCRSLDVLGIPWTRPSDRDIAVYRKEAVAQLDRFVGPKT